MLSKQEKELQQPTSADVSATRHTTTVGKSQRMISEVIVACVFDSSLNSVFECIFYSERFVVSIYRVKKLWVVSCCGSQLLAYTYYVVYMLSIGAFFSHCDMYNEANMASSMRGDMDVCSAAAALLPSLNRHLQQTYMWIHFCRCSASFSKQHRNVFHSTLNINYTLKKKKQQVR